MAASPANNPRMLNRNLNGNFMPEILGPSQFSKNPDLLETTDSQLPENCDRMKFVRSGLFGALFGFVAHYFWFGPKRDEPHGEGGPAPASGMPHREEK